MTNLRFFVASCHCRLGISMVASALAGMVVPDVGCGGTESWCIDSGGCGEFSETTCQGTPGCTWAPYCSQLLCGYGGVPKAECATKTG